MKINTEILKLNIDAIDEEKIRVAADIIKKGGLVAVPTETVYGLAANALDVDAVAQIYNVKGRPSDNPMIVHIAEEADVQKYAVNIPDSAYILMQKFWPGPLTLVLPKRDIIPDRTSGGLDSVAIRMPCNEIMRRLIKLSGVPIAAPSANLSGKPSPTAFSHVYNDLYGKVPAIIDGGNCNVGVESTIVSLLNNEVRLLRPGAITYEMIKELFPNAVIDKAVSGKISENDTVRAPGMKYRHYAPRAPITVLKGSDDTVIEYINSNSDDNTGVICFCEDTPKIKKGVVKTLGKRDNNDEMAANLFSILREFDDSDVVKILARCPSTEGVGFAVYNRLVKASGFTIINL